MRTTIRLVATLIACIAAGCTARANGNTDFKAFFEQTFPLAGQDFTSVQGAPVRFEPSSFVANVRTDPSQFSSCRISRSSSTFLICALPQYDSTRWDDAVRDIELALPPGFNRFNNSLSPTSRQFVWVRHSDTMAVELTTSFGNQPLNVWVQQMLKVPAQPAIVDADAAPIPIFQNLRPVGTIAVGLVIAQDAAKSYILTALSQPTKPLYAGAPFAPGVWREVPGDVVAADPATNLTLLSVPVLPIRPHALIANVAQGESLEILSYGSFGPGSLSNCFYEEFVDAVSCTISRGPAIVSAVHANTHEFEHSAVPFDGAPLADASSHRIVGVSLSSSPEDGSIAVEPAAISVFLQSSAPAVATLMPQPQQAMPVVPDAAVIARIKASLVRLEAFDPQHPRSPEKGTGAVVGADRNGVLVITAAHVLPSPKPPEGYRVTAYLANAQSSATVRRVDTPHDIALLYIPGARILPLRLATSAPFGTRIAALGYGEIEFRFFPDDLSTELVEGTIGQVTGGGLVNYDIATVNGFSGGPVFNLRDGSLVGIVHGETKIGAGGYEGVDVVQIRQLLRNDPPDPPAAASASVARITKSLALLDCPKSPLVPSHLTGVVVASDSHRSYIATGDLDGCQPIVHIAGDKRTAYQGREVSADRIALVDKFAQPPQVDLVEIGASHLTPVALNAPATSTHAYILSFAESTIAQHAAAAVVPPRVDETDVSAGSDRFEANGGVDPGAAVFDATYARFLGIVPSAYDAPSLGELNKYGGIASAPPSAARSVYSLVGPSEIVRRMVYSVDDVPYQRGALAENFPVAIFAVLQQGRLAGSPTDYYGFGTAVPVGSKNSRSYFVTSLGPSDRDRLVLDVSARDGATQKFDATVVAYDTSTTLAILSTALTPLQPPRWGLSLRAGAVVLAPYYNFCSWEPSRAAALRISPYALPACRVQISRGNLQDFFHNGTLSVSSLRGVLGRSFQGSPVVDPVTLRVDGLIAPDIFASVIGGDRVVAFLRANGWTVETQ